MKLLIKISAGFCLAIAFSNCFAQRQMEYLNRGVHAQRIDSGKVFISWRLLADEPNDIGFNVYRANGDLLHGGSDKAFKLNEKPITSSTNFVDNRAAAVDNADLASTEPYQGKEHWVFKGKCIAIVKANANSGDIKITASADELKSAGVTINVKN